MGKIDTRSEYQWAANIIDGTWLSIPSLGLASVTIFLFQDWVKDTTTSTFSWWRMGLLTIFAVVTLLVAGRSVAKYPWTCAVSALIATAVSGSVVYTVQGLTFFLVSVWFFLCALITKWSASLLREPGRWRSIEWERGVGYFLVLVVFFAVSIYGHVSFRFGGGAPVPVKLHLTADAPKFFAGDPATAFLLEETDSDFYLLRSPQDRSSLFLPRTIVKALEFNVNDGDGQKSSEQHP